MSRIQAAVISSGSELEQLIWDRVVQIDDLDHFLNVLDKMDKIQATILRLRFGLGDEEPKNLEEISNRLGFTRERARQIEAEALCKLAELLGPN